MHWFTDIQWTCQGKHRLISMPTIFFLSILWLTDFLSVGSIVGLWHDFSLLLICVASYGELSRSNTKKMRDVQVSEAYIKVFSTKQRGAQSIASCYLSPATFFFFYLVVLVFRRITDYFFGSLSNWYRSKLSYWKMSSN